MATNSGGTVSETLGNVQNVSSEETTGDESGGVVQVETKNRPPPIDISIAQELQHQNSHESRTPTSAMPYTPSFSGKKSDKEKKIGHRRVNEEGQITYKKIETTQIMGSIQLGISYAVGSLASKPDRDILMQDFTMVETTSFPNDGSNMTPAHHYSDFKFKTYSPFAFRHFRDLFGIQPDDFLLSVCNEPLRELSNPGASGSIFYLTNDDEFIIKTVQHKEAEFLQKLLPGYYMNLNQNPRTLLPKFFGLFNYQCGGKNVRLIVMNNLLPSFIKMHQKYDLKGSTYKRRANKYERNKESPTYKDLDFSEHHPEGILLEAETYAALVKTITRDCRVLESFKIMDYSLLVGIHNLDQAAKDKAESRIKKEIVEQQKAAGLEPDGSGKMTGKPINLTRSKSINRQRLAAFSTAMESIQAEVEPIDQDEDVPPGGIPARNSKGERLLLFLGVIDILQSYRLKKKLEHTWKSMLHDGDTVSVHRPGFYASRFLDFMSKSVFKKIPSLDLPEIKGPHRKFRTLVSSVIALKHSPSKRKGASIRNRPSSLSENEAAKLSSEQGTSANANTTAKVTEGGNNGENTSVVDSGQMTGSVATTNGMSEQNVSSFLTQPISIPDQQVHQQTLIAARASPSMTRSKQRSNTDPVSGLRMVQRSPKTSHSSLDRSDVVSISQVTIQTESLGSMSETSSSSTSGLGSSTIRTVTWTPPHSVEGSTPTHTEGTPSFTESSSSGDMACPTTPVKSIGSRDSYSVRDVSSPQFYFETEMSRPFDPTSCSTAPLVSRLALPSIGEDQADEQS